MNTDLKSSIGDLTKVSLGLKTVRFLLWVALVLFGIILASHLLWITVTPKGFWIIPRTRQITVPPIGSASASDLDATIKIDTAPDERRINIAPSELLGTTPGQRIFVIEQMYFADNQPTVIRATPIRFLVSYPLPVIALIIFGLFRVKRLISQSARTSPLRGAAGDFDH